MAWTARTCTERHVIRHLDGTRSALQEFHDKVAVSVGKLTIVEHLYNAWMAESGCDVRFIAEAPDRVWLLSQFGNKYLYGGGSAQLLMLSLIDSAHSSLA